MERAKAFTETEIGKIDVLHELGKSQREITSTINRSQTVVSHYLSLGEKYGQNLGRPKVTERTNVELSTLLRSSSP